MKDLISVLDDHIVGWREQYIVVIDNCPAHTSAVSLMALAHLGVPLMFTAPASYKALPVEAIFGLLKATDLNGISDPSE